MQQTSYAQLYFDHIHLSAEGNQWVGQALANLVKKAWLKPGDGPSHPGNEPMNDLW
jgi:hypothetical protein